MDVTSSVHLREMYELQAGSQVCGEQQQKICLTGPRAGPPREHGARDDLLQLAHRPRRARKQGPQHHIPIPYLQHELLPPSRVRSDGHEERPARVLRVAVRLAQVERQWQRARALHAELNDARGVRGQTMPEVERGPELGQPERDLLPAAADVLEGDRACELRVLPEVEGGRGEGDRALGGDVDKGGGVAAHEEYHTKQLDGELMDCGFCRFFLGRGPDGRRRPIYFFWIVN